MADITRLEQFLNHIAHPEDPIPAPQTRIEQNLVEIAENKGGGGGLPDYTEANPGDVLTAIGYGQLPQWIPPQGGGGGVFVVESEVDMQTGSVTLGKTWQEIYDAMASGKFVTALVTVENEYANSVAYTPLLGAVSTPSSGTYYITAIGNDGTGLSTIIFIAASADSYPVQQS